MIRVSILTIFLAASSIEAFAKPPDIINFCRVLLQAPIPYETQLKVAELALHSSTDSGLISYVGIGIKSFQRLLHTRSVSLNNGLNETASPHLISQEENGLLAARYDATQSSRAEVLATRFATRDPDDRVYNYIRELIQNRFDQRGSSAIAARFLTSSIPEYLISPTVKQKLPHLIGLWSSDSIKAYLKFVTFGEWLHFLPADLIYHENDSVRQVWNLLRMPLEGGYVLGLNLAATENFKNHKEEFISLDQILFIQGVSRQDQDDLNGIVASVKR